MKILFFRPTYFERLIYYFLIPDFFARVIYEIILRVPPITVNQPKQFLFYGFVALELLLIALGRTSLRPNLGRVGAIGILLSLMTFQGVLVGLWWGNSFTRLAIDTVNVVIVLANLVIFSDPRSTADTHFARVFTVNRYFAISMILLSVVAMAVNPSSSITLGGSVSNAVCLSLLLAELIVLKGLSPANIAKFLVTVVILGATIQSWNRTTLLFLAAAVLMYLVRRVGRNPYRVVSIATAFAFMAVTVFALLPEDSALSRRITGLESVDLSARTGSIGEREAEADAIGEMVSSLGRGGVLFGAGHGASYDVRYTWEWKLNYSNAHYGWVLFYMRYGEVGYLYFGAWILALLVSIYRTWRSNNPTSIGICLLAIWNIGYLGTYGYFSFFIAGVPFMHAAVRRFPYTMGQARHNSVAALAKSARLLEPSPKNHPQ